MNKIQTQLATLLSLLFFSANALVSIPSPFSRNQAPTPSTKATLYKHLRVSQIFKQFLVIEAFRWSHKIHKKGASSSLLKDGYNSIANLATYSIFSLLTLYLNPKLRSEINSAIPLPIKCIAGALLVATTRMLIKHGAAQSISAFRKPKEGQVAPLSLDERAKRLPLNAGKLAVQLFLINLIGMPKSLEG